MSLHDCTDITPEQIKNLNYYLSYLNNEQILAYVTIKNFINNSMNKMENLCKIDSTYKGPRKYNHTSGSH